MPNPNKKIGNLDNIKIENFKSIRTLNLDLNSLNVFIGANGSGKSNFIGIFKFLNKIINRELQTYTGQCGGADAILHYGRKRSDHLSVELSFSEKVNGYRVKLVPTVDDRFVFAEEEVWFHDKKYSEPYRKNLGSGHSESILKDISEKRIGRIAKYVIETLKEWKVYHFHDTSESAKVKQNCNISNNVFLMSDAGNLAAFLYHLKENYPQHYKIIEDTVRLVAPFFGEFYLAPLRENKEKIILRWREKNEENIFNASALSDGTLRFICLATLLLQPELPSVVILDEPELGLHPYAITLLGDLVRAASHRTQLIIATQSVTFVNQFGLDDLFVVERDIREGDTTINKLDREKIKEWLDDFSLGELWEKNVLGGRP
ncbi:MAG: AAA family ATPase [Chitinispirillaceae bacterium]|nr:AAA family ATPase [Chitinispirillaceae bacterium]